MMEKKRINSICIITSPFGCIPPYAIGAVEKRWKSCGKIFSNRQIKVTHISKRPSKSIENDSTNIYVDGYNRTGSWIKDALFDLIYSFKALRKAPKSDAIVLNTLWTPILLPLFKHKFKVSLYNVARFPKHQFAFYKAVDILSCVSIVTYEELIRQTPSAELQACVVNNFIDIDVFTKHKEHNASTTPTIIYTGRVHREKGIELLVEAINQVRQHYDVSLKIIGAWDTGRGGSGDIYKEELNNMASGWKIDWMGPIYSPSELASAMDEGDIYCYPSLAEKGETFGVAPLEAMGLGIPTIVSSLRCFKDFIKDGENGLVFDHHSPDAANQLAAHIKTLIEDKALYKYLSENSFKSSMEFSVQKKAEEYLLVLNNYCNYQETGFNRTSLKVEPVKD